MRSLSPILRKDNYPLKLFTSFLLLFSVAANSSSKAKSLEPNQNLSGNDIKAESKMTGKNKLIAESGLDRETAAAKEIKASESQDVMITIYNQDFGVIKDVRNIELHSGLNFLRFEDVAAKIDPTSVSFASLTAPNAVAVREQNYQYDLIDPETILSKSLGKTVTFRQYLANGNVKEITGVLLNGPTNVITTPDGTSQSVRHGLVLKTATGIVLNPSGEAELSELPPGLVSKPSLLWKLEAAKAGKHKTEIAYQTAGLNWHCDYVVVVNADDSQADLISWVTLDNKCGATFKNAALKLMAGDVNKIQPAKSDDRFSGVLSRAAVAMPQQFTEESFSEYHLYSLAGRTDLADNETKQMSMFSANKINTQKRYIFEAEQAAVSYPMVYGTQAPNKVHVKLEMLNSKENGLGLPMPKGKVRVYKKDKEGSLQFIGEDLIDHTARDEKIRVYIGDAFDIVGERKQTNQQQVSDRVQRLSYEISLRNHKDTAATVTDVEHCYGDWSIMASSQSYKKRDSHTFEFEANVPANGETTVSYTVETRW